jgi:multimeric flavodoxin WrbA
MARVEDFGKENWREVLSYDTIIVGTPARFWTMSWETKRFVDLVIGRIYVLPEKAKGKQFALFATAEIESSGNTALENMSMWVNDIRGNLVLKLNLNREQSQQEFDQAIDKFTDGLAVLIK